MGKRTHNIGKGEASLYRSVHAGRLAATHPVAARLLADRRALIDWHGEIAGRLFRPNPLVRAEASMQKRAKEASKGSPWFSGYAQNFACDIGTKLSNIEAQLRTRIARSLASGDEESPKIRVRKRDVGKPQPPERKFTNVPMNVENIVTADDFKALKALVVVDKDESIDDSLDDDDGKPRKAAPWVKPCAEARDAMIAAESKLPADSPKEARDAALTSAMRSVLDLHNFNPAQSAIVADACLRAFASYTCPVFGAVWPNTGTDRFVLRLELDARGYDDNDLRNKPEAFRAQVTGAMDRAWESKSKVVFTHAVDLLDLRNRQGDRRPVLPLPIAVQRGVWDTATMAMRLGKTKPARPPSIRNVALEVGPDFVDVRLNIDLARRTPDIDKTRSSQVHKLTDGDFLKMVDAINARDALLGRDIGFVNTVSYGAVRRDRDVTVEDVKNAVTLKTKEQCREHILSHWHPCLPMLDEDGKPFLKHRSGRNFLECIADHASYIDKLRAQIDLNYKKMEELKRDAAKPLGLSGPAEFIRRRCWIATPCQSTAPEWREKRQDSNIRRRRNSSPH